ANQYSFTLPAFTPGTWVDYWIEASDQVSPLPNVTVTDTFRFIAGNYIKYDNGQVDFYGTVGPGGTSGVASAAVRVTLNGTADLVTMLIRNYDGTGNTTPTPPNAPMLIHVWNDVAGLPGTDMLTTPVYANAESTVANNMRFTRVDLRPYSSLLSGLSGDFHIGFSVPTGVTNILLTQPGTFNRTSVYDGISWFPATGSSGISDYHFRCITSEVITGVSEPKTAGIALYPNPSEGQLWLGLEGLEPGTANLWVMDLTGRMVYEGTLNISGNAQTELLDLSELPSGIYTLGIMSGDDRFTRKLVIR
ncbi:MAG: T9SS type A sorting domain-containing protein, partial [Bacteroidales bacterium]|nr:T9SS type A sorting domain-containing protein [Bacteroidales bacterium]